MLPVEIVSSVLTPDQLSRTFLDWLKQRKKDKTPLDPRSVDLVADVFARYRRLERSAKRKVLGWRLLRVTMLLTAAPIAPLALTRFAWVAAILGAALAVMEGALAVWRLPETAKAEFEMAVAYETEVTNLDHGRYPYNKPTREENEAEFADRICRLKGQLTSSYVGILDASLLAAAKQDETFRAGRLPPTNGTNNSTPASP